MRGPSGLWIQNGKLYVADTQNHRILIFNSIPTSNGAAADLVLGQPNLTTFVEPDLTKANTGLQGGINPGVGFPNGRRLTDDVIDIELTLVNNGNPLGDNVNANDVQFGSTFPFLAPSQQPRVPGTIDDNTRN